jgi:hypothetical protein
MAATTECNLGMTYRQTRFPAAISVFLDLTPPDPMI